MTTVHTLRLGEGLEMQIRPFLLDPGAVTRGTGVINVWVVEEDGEMVRLWGEPALTAPCGR